MKRRWFVFLLGMLAMILAGCSMAADLPQPVVGGEAIRPPIEVVEGALPPRPDEVTRDFYEWYLGVSETTNPLVSGIYRDHENLSPAFVETVDATLASFDGRGGFDPILLAQDVPVQIEVGEPVVSGQEATVTVLRYWGGNPDPSPMRVSLIHAGGRWLIDGVSADVAIEPAMMGLVSTAGPADVVQIFYDWYLAYIGDRASGTFRNPLVDRVYRESPLLTNDFKQHLDEMLDQQVAEFGGFMADPILCAQDIPEMMMTGVTRMSPEGATTVVSTSFINHLISVDLQQEGDSWLIRHITCPGTPAGTAKIFYDWYLGYIGDWAGDFHNPLVDRAYRDHPLLAESLEQEMDALLDAPDGIRYDPFLLAQDVPATFSVDPGPEPDTAIVHFYFGPGSVRHVLVTVKGNQIVSIGEASPNGDGPPESEIDTNDWLTLADSGSGVAFRYPPGWVAEPFGLEGPGMPDDWPVVAGWRVMPQEIADLLAAAEGAPPDPNAPIILAPIQIEVISGGQDQLLRVMPSIYGETAMVGSNPVTVVAMEPGYYQYLLPHPQQPDFWFVLTDWVTGFPGREELAEGVLPVVEGLLASLAFSP
jgi:hypothetical protein